MFETLPCATLIGYVFIQFSEKSSEINSNPRFIYQAFGGSFSCLRLYFLMAELGLKPS